ncbi:MAG: hypothetical protein ABNO52_00020 [Candidatus Shikimatogenerans sp. Tser]|uniref:Uncharacterized protein n=1 Tax=Candidatus Shikimatogenerans sp. Tser TaxID=3158568 RepID=A0AAU7QQU3_9FLAO
MIYNYNCILFFNKKIIQNHSNNKLKKIFIYLLNKYKIKNYNNKIIDHILYIIQKRLKTYKDFLLESLFFFKRPKYFFCKKKYIKRYKYIFYNIKYLIKYNKINNIFIFNNINYFKFLRLIITGKLIGISLLLIIKNINKKEIYKRILFFIKKFFKK